jgi:integrase
MGRPRKKRRQSHGSAWHWNQTDCWYYTLPGTKKRVALFDEQGNRIRGLENRDLAEQALARAKIAGLDLPPGELSRDWEVAKVCSEYLQYCERNLAAGRLSRSHRDGAVLYLNDLCAYCGALKVSELKKSHIQTWVENHPNWRSAASRRRALATVSAAFNRAQHLSDIPNPLMGLKKPDAPPRLQSFSPEDEQKLYDATEECFRQFLFAAMHTGLRPFSELAKITADHVEISDRGMMWRIYASKTKKTRKIPIHADVAKLARKLMQTAPKGSGKPLFRNTKGAPWKGTTGVVRFLTLKQKLGWDQHPEKSRYSCYTCRHTFVHRMLSGFWNRGKGCSIETVAELIGDTPKVAFDHYGKEWGQHYQDPLWAAIGVTGNSKRPSTASKGPGTKIARRKASRTSTTR